MAKMAHTIGLFLPCLYLQFPFKKFVQQFEESQTLYDTVESEFYSLIIAECQKERIFFDHADLEMHIGNVEHAHWQRGTVSKVLRETLLGTVQSKSKCSSYRQKTRTREL